MKKWHYLIGLAIFLLFPLTTFAVPAYPGLVKMKQPNGDEISVYLKGDEKVHWMESPDGYSLLYDNDKRIVFATTDETGNMVPSSIVFQDTQLRSSAVNGQIAGIPKNLRYSASQVNMLKSIWNVAKQSMEKAAPNAATGTIRAICALVQFPDKFLVKNVENFEQLLNQSGYNADGARGSVRDFYYENSYGQLNLIITVIEPYTARHNLSYYGGNDQYGNDNYEHLQELAGDVAAHTFSRLGINPADYDNDGDDYIDAFHFIYAGYGEEAGAEKDAIWAHETGIYDLTFGNKRLNKYSCSPELRGSSGTGITRIGVICHEMGHIFGLPDFYDADSETGGSFLGTGRWDVMASGSWNGGRLNDGSSPAHNNMFSKIKLGWVEPVELSSSQEITGMPNSAENPVAYIYESPVPGEYFILENRQKEGFDSYVPGTGLLIYHVSLTDQDISDNRVNNTHPQKLYPVCASSTYKVPNTTPSSYGSINSSGCTFPEASKTSFTDYTTPSSVTWRGINTNKPITEIKEENKMISFKFMQNDAAPVAGFTVTDEGNNVRLQWDKPNDNVLGYNIYRNNTLLIKLSGADNTSYIQNNVSPGSYNYCVTAYYAQDESTYSCQEIYIAGNPNGYPAVTNLQARLNDKSVELSWNVPKAERDWVTHSSNANRVISFKNTNFSTVVRFSTEDLRNFVGRSLTQVKFYLFNMSCTHTVQIWHFDPNLSVNDGFPDTRPDVTQPMKNTAEGNVTIDLTAPLKIQSGKELWIGINYELNPMSAVAAVDAGPKVEDRNFVLMGNRWYSIGDDCNFSIAGGLILSESPDKYIIYRDNEWRSDVTTEYYLDNAVSGKNHIYCISAVYGNQESEQSCVQSPFMTGIINPFFGTVKTYPNPIKQGDVLTIDLGTDFAGAKISFYSVSGQLLQQVDAPEKIYRQKIDFVPGIYTLQIRQNTQIISRKMIVK